jgi:DNA-binding MarR family transcriptional regulator
VFPPFGSSKKNGLTRFGGVDRNPRTKAAYSQIRPPSETRNQLSVRSDGPDLTARQLSVFLKVYLEPDVEQTVRGLAADLNISKPATSRALDRLAEFDFTKRETDPNDRRSVIAKRTPTGSAYLRTLSGYMAAASKQAEK